MELLACGTTLITLLVCSCALAAGGDRLDVDVSAESHRVRAGEPVRFTLVIRNLGGSRTSGTTVAMPLGDGMHHIPVPPLAARAARSVRGEVVAARREVLRLGPATVHRGDPLGLVDRERRLSRAIAVYVHPEIVRLPEPDSGPPRDLDGVPCGPVVPDDIEFHGLDEARPGDDPRRVHWPASARTGRIMVRRYRASQRADMLLELSTDLRRYVSAEEFELAVSVYASLGVQCLTHDRVLVARVGGARPVMPRSGARHVQTFLDECSGIRPETRSSRHGVPDVAWESTAQPMTVMQPVASAQPAAMTSPTATATSASAMTAHASRRLIVVGSRASDDDIRAAVASGNGGMACAARRTGDVEVLQVSLGADGDLRRHGGVRVTIVGALSQLPALLRAHGDPGASHAYVPAAGGRSTASEEAS
ncbi:DUF58 domain-containing protein [Bifidobacterium moraviense]|uniref:DUF58 domain-containing protein n=1 Tax=Bifidobacterium moraviense TaxID=2675323 RepID=UPI00145D8E04